MDVFNAFDSMNPGSPMLYNLNETSVSCVVRIVCFVLAGLLSKTVKGLVQQIKLRGINA